MNLLYYLNTNKISRTKFIDNITSTVGLKYFGGKQRQIRELMNHIFNLLCQMYVDNKPCDYFIDAFAGGGKISLTLPTYGWTNKIVINDLNNYIYSYYKTCKEKPAHLIKMIEALGEIMCEDLFYVMLYHLNHDNYGFNPVTKAAFVYWVTKSAWDGQTDDNASYHLKYTPDEQNEIKNIISNSHKQIKELSRLLNKKNNRTGEDIYIIENLDYLELMRKYHTKGNVMYYLDPPYVECTLVGNSAHYVYNFSRMNTLLMNKVLKHGIRIDNRNYIIDYYIKSDYDPKYNMKENYKGADFDKYIKGLRTNSREYRDYNIFNCLEKGDNHKIFLGQYRKSNDSMGYEYIWCKGFAPEYYNQNT